MSTAEKLWVGARATHGVKDGKYYFEATITSSGICRVGWSTMAAHLELGKDSHGYGYGGTGMKSFNGTFVEYGGKYSQGDVVGCFVDWKTKEISYSVNGVDKGVAFTIGEGVVGAVLFPAFVLKGASISLNFGRAPFRFFNSSHGGAKVSGGGASSAVATSARSGDQGFRGLANADPNHIIACTAREAFQVSGKRSPLALILEPARDLAEQVYNSLEDMAKYVNAPQIKSLLLVGGDEGRKLGKIVSAGVDVVVGTLGKVEDMVKNRGLDLSQIRFFVLDEADRLTDPENMAQIMYLYNQCPGGGTGDNRLQVLSCIMHYSVLVYCTIASCTILFIFALGI